MTVGDFNGDGKQDLATANYNGNNVTVLIGNGSGGFTPATGSPFAAGTGAYSIAVGDFTRDGIQALAVANYYDADVTVLVGNGDGTFTADSHGHFGVGATPVTVTVGDFNGDGLQDLVTANHNDGTITLLYGDGTGNFASPTGGTLAAGTSPQAVVTGDFNGDGIQDLAVTDSSNGQLNVLLGTLTPTTSALSTTSSPLTITFGATVPMSVAVSDNSSAFQPLTGVANFSDGATVIGAASQSTSPFTFTTPILNVGSHALTATYSGGSGSGPSSSNTLNVLVQNTQTISFPGLSSVTLGVAPFTISATASSGLTVTFNSNSSLVFTVNVATVTIIAVGTCSITAQQAGGGNYGPAPPATQFFGVVAGTQTVTLDAIPPTTLGTSPFVVAAQASSQLPVTVASSTPAICKTSGTLVQLLATGTCTIQANQAGNANFSSAGATDNFPVLAASPAGTLFAFGGPLAVGTAPGAIAHGDFNGDGFQDIVTANATANSVTVLMGSVGGAFTAATGSPFAVDSNPVSVVVGDFNGDGHLDIATANLLANSVTVLLGDGSGGFSEAPGSPIAVAQPRSLAVGDFNGDGIDDLALANPALNEITILLGDGTGKLAGGVVAGGSSPEALAVGDFDGDGIQDLAIANNPGYVTVLLGQRFGRFHAGVGTVRLPPEAVRTS